MLTEDINGKNPSMTDVSLSFALNYLGRKVKQAETMFGKILVRDKLSRAVNLQPHHKEIPIFSVLSKYILTDLNPSHGHSSSIDTYFSMCASTVLAQKRLLSNFVNHEQSECSVSLWK